MAYTTKAKVKERLDIAAAVTTWDTEIDNIITDVDAEIDSIAQNHTTTPFDPVPAIIDAISKELSCVEFQMRRSPSAEAADNLKRLRDLALEKLNVYLRETFAEADIAFVVGEADQ